MHNLKCSKNMIVHICLECDNMPGLINDDNEKLVIVGRIFLYSRTDH